jgi:biopolymer transport protein ExbD
MHDFLKKPKRAHVKEIPLAPILDLLTVVIFFLILSTSFIELRQNILPPSSTITTKSEAIPDNSKLPLSPKLLMVTSEREMILMLNWLGEKPDKIVKKIKISNNDYNVELKSTVQKIVKEFKAKFPDEKALQIGWEGNLKYQTVLNVVDGVILEIKDIAFLSPEETLEQYKKSVE